ncbi:hypothetical protein M9435_003836 [Picochlorum sp. BPE23]|nr:hypothetical protein M9435_003836 [Picochlorum sp. BPE23]
MNDFPLHYQSVAFGCSLKDLARQGLFPVVLFDCVKLLSKFGLKGHDLFSGPMNRKKLLQLKYAYDEGRRPLKGKNAQKRVSVEDAANLLILWLSSLPEPMLPVEAVWKMSSGIATNKGSMFSVIKTVLMETEPFILEAMFPLFELLHHFYLNQQDREGCLEKLATLFSPPIFGIEDEHGLQNTGVIQDACCLMIREYRGLFTQPSLPVHVVQDPTTTDSFEGTMQNMIDSTMAAILCGLGDSKSIQCPLNNNKKHVTHDENDCSPTSVIQI